MNFIKRLFTSKTSFETDRHNNIEYYSNHKKFKKYYRKIDDIYKLDFSDEEVVLAIAADNQLLQLMDKKVLIPEYILDKGIKINPLLVKIAETVPEHLQFDAVKAFTPLYKYISNPTDDVSRYAIGKLPYLIEAIESPSLELQQLAVRRNVRTVLLIEEPAESILDEAVKSVGINGTGAYAIPYETASEEIFLEQAKVHYDLLPDVYYYNSPLNHAYPKSYDAVQKIYDAAHDALKDLLKNGFDAWNIQLLDKVDLENLKWLVYIEYGLMPYVYKHNYNRFNEMIKHAFDRERYIIRLLITIKELHRDTQELILDVVRRREMNTSLILNYCANFDIDLVMAFMVEEEIISEEVMANLKRGISPGNALLIEYPILTYYLSGFLKEKDFYHIKNFNPFIQFFYDIKAHQFNPSLFDGICEYEEIKSFSGREYENKDVQGEYIPWTSGETVDQFIEKNDWYFDSRICHPLVLDELNNADENFEDYMYEKADHTAIFYDGIGPGAIKDFVELDLSYWGMIHDMDYEFFVTVIQPELDRDKQTFVEKYPSIIQFYDEKDPAIIKEAIHRVPPLYLSYQNVSDSIQPKDMMYYDESYIIENIGLPNAEIEINDRTQMDTLNQIADIYIKNEGMAKRLCNMSVGYKKVVLSDRYKQYIADSYVEHCVTHDEVMIDLDHCADSILSNPKEFEGLLNQLSEAVKQEDSPERVMNFLAFLFHHHRFADTEQIRSVCQAFQRYLHCETGRDDLKGSIIECSTHILMKYEINVHMNVMYHLVLNILMTNKGGQIQLLDRLDCTYSTNPNVLIKKHMDYWINPEDIFSVENLGALLEIIEINAIGLKAANQEAEWVQSYLPMVHRYFLCTSSIDDVMGFNYWHASGEHLIVNPYVLEEGKEQLVSLGSEHYAILDRGNISRHFYLPVETMFESLASNQYFSDDYVTLSDKTTALDTNMTLNDRLTSFMTRGERYRRSYRGRDKDGYYSSNNELRIAALHEMMTLLYQRYMVSVGQREAVESQMNDFDVMNGFEFEEYICNLFKAMDYKAEITSLSNDYGVDILLSIGQEKVAIQVKNYSNPVGNKAVQEVLGGMKYYDAKHGAVLTNSSYTRQAKLMAAETGIILIDGDDLERMTKDGREVVNGIFADALYPI